MRIELTVEDPEKTQARAVAAGAEQISAIHKDVHNMVGPRPMKSILQGMVKDPFGHLWLIGRPER